tara:strand:- start:384 stop:1298 length:915 start_codon:yes stop_codon:yes gene_type:complete
MRYVNAILGFVIALIFFIIATLIIPGQGPSKNVELILTISTFLFAILAGFFISRSVTKFNEIKRAVVTEDALFLSLYKTSQILGKEFSDKIRDLIDKYYIVSYDFALAEYAVKTYKQTNKHFLAMWDTVKKFKKKESSAAYKIVLDILIEIEKNRNMSSETSREKLGTGRWLILIALSAIILFSIFYLKTTDIYSYVVTILLSTVLVLVLLIIRDLQNLVGTSEEILIESGQEVFEDIGKLRYYNEEYLKGAFFKVPKHVNKYRLGIHKPGEKIKIKVVNRDISKKSQKGKIKKGAKYLLVGKK